MLGAAFGWGEGQHLRWMISDTHSRLRTTIFNQKKQEPIKSGPLSLIYQPHHTRVLPCSAVQFPPFSQSNILTVYYPPCCALACPGLARPGRARLNILECPAISLRSNSRQIIILVRSRQSDSGVIQIQQRYLFITQIYQINVNIL